MRATRMNERDEGALGAGSRLFIHQLHAAGLELLEDGADVFNPKRDVVKTGAALVDVLRDGRVGRRRLQQFQTRLPCRDEMGANTLRRDLLRHFDVEAERIAIERQRGVEIFDGDADVVEDSFHRVGRPRNALITSSNSGMPSPVVATVFTIGGRHCEAAYVFRLKFDSMADTTWSAPSRSALLTTKMSAISMMPALSACTSSPAPGTRTTIDTSAVRTIPTSACPTPTVSMMTKSLPAASRTIAASAVARARPPRWPRVAMLRMNTPSSAECD